MAPNFVDRSFLQNIPLDKQMLILRASDAAAQRAFVSTPISSQTSGGLWSDFLNALYLSVEEPYVAAKIILRKFGESLKFTSDSSDPTITASSIVLAQNSLSGIVLDGNGGVRLLTSADADGVSRAVDLGSTGNSGSILLGGTAATSFAPGSIVSAASDGLTVRSTHDGFDTTLAIGADAAVTLAQASGGNSYVFSLIGENPDGSSRYNLRQFDVGGVSWNGAGDLAGALDTAFSASYSGAFSTGSNNSYTSLVNTQVYLQPGQTYHLPADEKALADAALVDKSVAAAAQNYLFNRSTLYGPGTLPGTAPYYGNAYFTGMGLASAFGGDIPPPSIIDVTVVGFGTGGDSVPEFPLVLDLTGRGIELVAQSQSAARFDALADGVQRQIGWVGATNGILVFDRNRNGVVDSSAEWFGQNFTRDGAAPPAGQTGFGALATLAQPGATAFSEATSLIDPVTGVSYFGELQVWIDANQDGATQTGELFGLADLDIQSIGLQASAVGRDVNGNSVVSTAAYTRADGTSGVIDDIGLSLVPSETREITLQSGVALHMLARVQSGTAQSAAGQASGALGVLQDQYGPLYWLSGDASLINYYMGKSNGNYRSGLQTIYEIAGAIYVASPGGGVSYYPHVEGDAKSVSQSMSALIREVTTFVSRVQAAANAQGADDIAAVAANGASAADLSTSAAAARQAAATAQSAWADAIAAYVRAQADAVTAASNILRVQNEVNGLVPAGGGFVSSGDAEAASALYKSLAHDFQYMVVAKSAMKIALGAFGQALGYDNTIFGAPGETAPPPTPNNSGDNVNHPTLFIAGAGNETLNANRSSDAFFFSGVNGSDVVNGFAPGVGKNLAAFLVTADTLFFQNSAANLILSYGTSANVTLTNVNINRLSLYDNIAGVSTASFQYNGGSVNVDLSSKTSRDQDGLIHIQNLVGSNFDDILKGDSNDNSIVGGAGNNFIEGGGGADTLDGGGGLNTIGYSWATSGVTIDLAAGGDSTGSTLRDFTNVIGSKYNDTINGVSGSTLTGGGGYDIYEFSGTGGVQTIVNGVSVVSLPQGELAMGGGVSLFDLRFMRSGNDLVITVIGAESRVAVRDWFAGAYAQLTKLTFSDGSQIGTSAIAALATLADAPSGVIENAGNIALVAAGNYYGLYGKDGSGNPTTGPLLRYEGAAVTAGQFSGWSPAAAAQTAGGYVAALRSADNASYSIWNVDAGGNYVTSVGLEKNDPRLWSYETQFNFDLGGDGRIGAPLSPSGVIENAGNVALVAVGGYYGLYGMDSAGNPTRGPLLRYQGADVTEGQFSGWSPAAAEKTVSGYVAAFRSADRTSFSIWNVDADGNYISNVGVAGNDPGLWSYETQFDFDLDGDGKIGAPVSPSGVIENTGNVALVTLSSYYWLYGRDGAGNPTTGPVLRYQGPGVTPGQFPGWSLVAAEQTASGYVTAFRSADLASFSIWKVDADGNYVSHVGVAGNDPGLWSYETQLSFDLDGDGKVGAPISPSGVIENAGNVALVMVSGYYWLYGRDGAGNPTTGPVLRYQGAGVTPGQFSGWSLAAAEQTASGYLAAFRNADITSFSIWTVDADGNYVSNVGVEANDPGLWSYETQLSFDLDGDGKIGAPVSPSDVIENAGNVALVTVSGYYWLYGRDGAGNPTTGPVLRHQGAGVTPGQFPGWSLGGAEATANGYEVALQSTEKQFLIWNVDKSGNYQSSVELGGARDNSDGSGGLFLQGDDLTITLSPTQSTVATAAGNAFTFGGHGSESITAFGLTDETFVFTPGAGQDILYGFVAGGGTGHDTLQFNASAFGAGLTAADQNADWQALLAHTADNAAGSAVITDVFGDSIILSGLSKASLTASDVRFV
ncbi:hypothetical protein [Methylosinus sp. RM1]|uniref:beta strand repeat-containing protein n=1 Tax=Methylosinus sp. RM1 TaxID=2583817 RepID=UPI001407295A|nr:hypothetical protein [Methylosinus sp. RM1]